MIQSAPFRRALLHPRYWLTWLGIGLLYSLVLLPYPWIYCLGSRLGRLSMRFLKRRVRIAKRNLELCFPDMSEEQRNALVVKNFESVGMGLFETGMAWFWSDRRIQRWCTAKGLEHIQHVRQNNQGILLVGLHFLTLELGGRVYGIHHPGVGVYRPNDNAVIDWLQIWGRTRSNKYLLNRKDINGMIRALKRGEIVWYAPDHDYGPHSSVFAPLFAVEEAASTVGSYILIRMGNAAVIPFTPRRLPNGKGYEIITQPKVEDFPINNKFAAAASMNKIVEKEIMRAPEQYMWLHRRFKTRPNNAPSFYE